MPPSADRKPSSRRHTAASWPVKRAISAGGIVVRKRDGGTDVALIRHRTMKGDLVWTFPKGAVEPDESVAEAALREVREETGLEAEIVQELEDVSYWYAWPPEQVRYNKTVHLFLMRMTGGDTARHDHEVEEVRFFDVSDAISRAAYTSERKVLEQVREVLSRW